MSGHCRLIEFPFSIIAILPVYVTTFFSYVSIFLTLSIFLNIRPSFAIGQTDVFVIKSKGTDQEINEHCTNDLSLRNSGT